MNELQKHINEAFRLVASIPVTEDGQEKMAMAKEHMRIAYRLADDQKKEDEKSHGR